MILEKWLAVGSIGLFAMFAGEMISTYYFMANIPTDFEYVQEFDADPKIIQFVSIGVAPAGILAAISFIMSKQYGSRHVGGMIIGGGTILLGGMVACYMLIPAIGDEHITDAVTFVPILFMVLSAPVMGFGLLLMRRKKIRPKKEYF